MSLNIDPNLNFGISEVLSRKTSMFDYVD